MELTKEQSNSKIFIEEVKKVIKSVSEGSDQRIAVVTVDESNEETTYKVMSFNMDSGEVAELLLKALEMMYTASMPSDGEVLQ